MVDNAAAAVARFIMAAPAALPMEQVLPVFLSALPLKADRSENEAVYTCLLGLIHMRHPDALQRLDAILGKSYSAWPTWELFPGASSLEVGDSAPGPRMAHVVPFAGTTAAPCSCLV